MAVIKDHIKMINTTIGGTMHVVLDCGLSFFVDYSNMDMFKFILDNKNNLINAEVTVGFTAINKKWCSILDANIEEISGNTLILQGGDYNES